ncbi:hypothetical protein D3C87_1260820 [compost metagenome]
MASSTTAMRTQTRLLTGTTTLARGARERSRSRAWRRKSGAKTGPGGTSRRIQWRVVDSRAMASGVPSRDVSIASALAHAATSSLSRANSSAGATVGSAARRYSLALRTGSVLAGGFDAGTGGHAALALYAPNGGGLAEAGANAAAGSSDECAGTAGAGAGEAGTGSPKAE